MNNFRILLVASLLLIALAPYTLAQEVDTSQNPSGYTVEKIYSRDEVTKPAVIISNPKLDYKMATGGNNVDGVVRLSMVLSSSGRVENIQVVDGLSLGQNNAAIRAARQIKFMPATKDGLPVSQSHTQEYTFQATLIEEGSAYELRGVRKVYVDAGGNREEQANITGEILQRLPDLQVVDTAGEAEVVLSFKVSDRKGIDTIEPKQPFGPPKQPFEKPKGAYNVPLEHSLGEGMVIKRLSATKQRLLLRFDDIRNNPLERRPSTNFAKAFVKAYKMANGLGDD
jgi:TonB family protein